MDLFITWTYLGTIIKESAAEQVSEENECAYCRKQNRCLQITNLY